MHIIFCLVAYIPPQFLWVLALPFQHFSENAFTLVSPVFTASQCNLEANDMLQPHPLSAALCMYEAVLLGRLLEAKRLVLV